MLPALSSLRQALLTRYDGYWELYATGLGNRASIAQTLGCLSAAALGQAGRGPAVSISLVDQRVQALAAHDCSILERVTHEWKPISDLNDDVFDEENDFWAVAWASALRFLNRPKIGTRALRVPDYLKTEMSVAVGTPLVLDIGSAIAFAHDQGTTYSDLRRVQLTVSGVIEVGVIRDLLASDSASLRRLESLRVLQGASGQLSVSAAHFLGELAVNNWPDDLDSQAGGGLPLLISLLSNRAPASTLLELAERLDVSIRKTSNPQYWAPVAYSLLGTGWKPW